MAGVESKKLKNLFFFGVSCVNYDSQDVTLDIITNIRRRFLVTKKPASNKLYRSAGGESFIYAYNFSFDRPLQWRVSRNKKVVEEIAPLAAGKYCINLYDDGGRDLKKTFFDSKHRWFKTNYYSPVSNETLVCSLVPKEFDEGTSLLMYMTGEIYPERLFSGTIPSCETVRQRVLSKVPTPMVTALTSAGIVYFMPEVDKENYEHILSEEEKNYKEETAPEVFVTEEDAASGFNLSVKDFDMSKNLNRTFDISLAEEFGENETAGQTPAKVTEEITEPYAPENSEDDGSVDAAISDAVQQINAMTSLDIHAEDILNFDLADLESSKIDDVDFSEDYITFDDTDPAIDEQLKHIDSVLDGTSVLNSERQLVIGENVVDDDYISSIIDGIISSAFSSDDAADEVAEPECIAPEEASVPVSAEDEDVVATHSDDDIILIDIKTDEEISVSEESQEVTKTHDEEELADVNVGDVGLEEAADALAKEIISKISAADAYIKETPADLTIASRGEVYSYYGSVDENGKRSGRGRTLMADGNIAYEGEYFDDKRKGQGSFYFKDGSLCYWGNWDNNVRSGFGVGVSSDDKAVHAGNWADNKPFGTGVRFNNDGTLMFVSSNCSDKKKGITISDLSDTSFTVRVWSEKDDAFIQREIDISDIIK